MLVTWKTISNVDQKFLQSVSFINYFRQKGIKSSVTILLQVSPSSPSLPDSFLRKEIKDVITVGSKLRIVGRELYIKRKGERRINEITIF